jgi:transcriptional regulator with XRE-family HTH domain
MKPKDRIRIRREELGLKMSDVARSARIGIDAYRDIEWHEDEAFTTANLGTMRAICKFLRLDLFSLFDIDGDLSSEVGAERHASKPIRNIVISTKRIALGLTREELGDLVGFETIAIDQIEENPDFLEQWSIQLIENLASQLQLSISVLL